MLHKNGDKIVVKIQMDLMAGSNELWNYVYQMDIDNFYTFYVNCIATRRYRKE